MAEGSSNNKYAVASPPTSANALRLKTILGTKIDSPKLSQALSQLSQYYGPNTPAARRNLRGNIEQRSLAINEQFLQAFNEVQQQLDAVADDISAMGRSCEEMTHGLAEARRRTASLLEQTDVLKAERARVDTQAEIANRFLERFQLSPADMNALRAQPLQDSFFVALRRVHEIHSGCKLLLQTNHQKAGLEIMNAMAQHQDAAYERLYRWVQNECRTLDKDVAEIPPILRDAVSALRQRPVLFNCCLDEVSGARRTAVARAFIDALSRGGPHGVPRPIEIHAHDPVRYVGDMLAWLHQAVAWEHELVMVLLGISPEDRRRRKREKAAAEEDVAGKEDVENVAAEKEVNEDGGGVDADQQGENAAGGEGLESAEASARGTLNHIFEGVCRNFTVRFDQSVVRPGIVVAYKLANLVEFYEVTIGNLLGDTSALVATIKECKQKAMTKCQDLLMQQGDKFLRSPPVPPHDLAPPKVVSETLARLAELLKTFDTGLAPPEAREALFAPVLKAVIEPLLKTCTLSAAELPPTDMAVYLINCTLAVRSCIAPYAFTSASLEAIDAQASAHMDTLISEQARSILVKCGVAGKIYEIERRASQPADAAVPLSEVPGMDAQSMAESMRAFDQFLATASALVMPECDRLVNVTARHDARSKVAALAASAYKTLYDAVTDPINKYEDVQSILLHNPEQVKILLA